MYNCLSIHDYFELQHLLLILFWLPGPYFPYHLIINWPQPSWDCLSMPSCFDLHSILCSLIWSEKTFKLCSLIWSEKLFILDPFPAVFLWLLSQLDKSHRPLLKNCCRAFNCHLTVFKSSSFCNQHKIPSQLLQLICLFLIALLVLTLDLWEQWSFRSFKVLSSKCTDWYQNRSSSPLLS